MRIVLWSGKKIENIIRVSFGKTLVQVIYKSRKQEFIKMKDINKIVSVGKV